MPWRFEHGEEGVGDVLAGVAGLRGGEAGLHAFQRRLLGVEEGLRRLAEEDGARQRAVVAVVAAGDLEERALAGLHRLVVPGQMRRGGVGARGQQRHDGGIVAAEAVDAADAGIVDLGDEIALAHAGLDRLDDAGVHRLDDAGGLAHVVDLGRALDRALPVDERRWHR